MTDNNMEFIREKLPTKELLCQLAEEAAELSQAALKLRRSFDNVNPTPTTPQEAEKALMSEVADVIECLYALDYITFQSVAEISQIINRKTERWAERLEAKT